MTHLFIVRPAAAAHVLQDVELVDDDAGATSGSWSSSDDESLAAGASSLGTLGT